MANFCTNCGAKVEKEYNFCINCGTKIDKSDMKKNNQLSKSAPSSKKRTEKKETAPPKIEKNKMTRGGYCGLSCRHCYEEFLDSGGGITGDFDSDGYVEYYCHLGHSISYGRFCEDYE